MVNMKNKINIVDGKVALKERRKGLASVKDISVSSRKMPKSNIRKIVERAFDEVCKECAYSDAEGKCLISKESKELGCCERK